MDEWTRRTVIAGAAAVALGCGGAGGRVPRPRRGTPDRPTPGPVAGGEPGTLFRPTAAEALPRIDWVETPPWFGLAGGLYCPSPRSAGSSLLLFTEKGRWCLSNRIKHFRELPTLLEQARALGTDILYLVDFYEGRADLSPEEYWSNKGDYEARADLGGQDALVEGIRAVQARGGKVILYIEPFIFNKSSRIGTAKGKEWSIRTTQGYPDDPYPDDWKLCPANPPFVRYMVEQAGKLVGTYGANGLFLDSYGYQRGWKCVETSHGHPPNQPDVFDDGAKALVGAMLAECRRHDPKAVLMSEGPRLTGLFHWLSASQDWGINALTDRWIWKAAGHAPVFTSGWSLDDLHQIVALGHRLALGGNYWFEAPPSGTLTAYLEREVPHPVPDKKDERFRRFYAESIFRVVHQYRNAGLLLGRPMPNVDRATPRRGERTEAFESRDGLDAILRECAAFAPKIDAGLAGATPPSPEAHVKKLVEARQKLGPVLAGSEVTVLGPPSEHSAAYRFEGPNGVAFTAVNVGEKPVDVSLPSGGWNELVEGGDGAAVPPHAVRIWLRA